MSKPTHFIVSIETIDYFRTRRFTEHAPPEYVINELLKKGKEISLDENDIEKKAQEFTKSRKGSISSGEFAYKQALKDLI